MNFFPKANLCYDPILERVELDYKGFRIVGQIFIRTERDLAVRILFPFKNFTAGLHKPYFSDPKSSYLNEDGIEYANSLLIELYNLLKILEEKSTEIDLMFPKLVIEMSAIHVLLEECNTSLKKDKAKMKARLYSPKDYQSKISTIKKHIEYLEFEIWRLEEQFFKNLKVINIPYTLRKDYLKYLHQKYLI